MIRKLNLECENCETQSEVSFDGEFVVEIKQIFCPFCGEEIERVEDIEQESEPYENEWEDDD